MKCKTEGELNSLINKLIDKAEKHEYLSTVGSDEPRQRYYKGIAKGLRLAVRAIQKEFFLTNDNIR